LARSNKHGQHASLLLKLHLLDIIPFECFAPNGQAGILRFLNKNDEFEIQIRRFCDLKVV